MEDWHALLHHWLSTISLHVCKFSLMIGIAHACSFHVWVVDYSPFLASSSCVGQEGLIHILLVISFLYGLWNSCKLRLKLELHYSSCFLVFFLLKISVIYIHVSYYSILCSIHWLRIPLKNPYEESCSNPGWIYELLHLIKFWSAHHCLVGRFLFIKVADPSTH